MSFTLTIGGGYGEHGRTCFLVEGKGVSFLLDCGTMEGDAEPTPRLSELQIKKADFLFLSHCRGCTRMGLTVRYSCHA